MPTGSEPKVCEVWGHIVCMGASPFLPPPPPPSAQTQAQRRMEEGKEEKDSQPVASKASSDCVCPVDLLSVSCFNCNFFLLPHGVHT